MSKHEAFVWLFLPFATIMGVLFVLTVAAIIFDAPSGPPKRKP